MKIPNIKFDGKPSSWSHADKFGRTERQVDMAKATGPFRHHTKGPEKNKYFKSVIEHSVMSL
jgi:hypothetical protein